jgi:hypothetical protein
MARSHFVHLTFDGRLGHPDLLASLNICVCTFVCAPLCGHWLSSLLDIILVTFLTVTTNAGQKQLKGGCCFGPQFEGAVHPGGIAQRQEAVGLHSVLCQPEAACYIVFPSQEAELAGA